MHKVVMILIIQILYLVVVALILKGMLPFQPVQRYKFMLDNREVDVLQVGGLLVVEVQQISV